MSWSSTEMFLHYHLIHPAPTNSSPPSFPWLEFFTKHQHFNSLLGNIYVLKLWYLKCLSAVQTFVRKQNHKSLLNRDKDGFPNHFAMAISGVEVMNWVWSNQIVQIYSPNRMSYVYFISRDQKFGLTFSFMGKTCSDMDEPGTGSNFFVR